MRILILFICMPLVSSELHTFNTTYTGTRGQTAAGIPEFSSVTSLDGHQMDYYDSITMKLIPKQDWMEQFEFNELWTEDIEIRKQVQQIYKNNIPVLMERFSQSDGVHTYQRMYGCEWDDKTEELKGFDKYIYDGQDFISLDLTKRRYTAHLPQANLTVEKWNNDEQQLQSLKRYYDHECVYWLKHFLNLRKSGFKKRGPTKEYILVCVVGFLVICALVQMKRKQKLQKIYQKMRRNKMF